MTVRRPQLPGTAVDPQTILGLVRAGRLDEARRGAEMLASAHAVGFTLLAQIEDRLGHREEAIEATDKGLSAHPGDRDLRLTRGRLLLAAGQADAAAVAFEAQVKDAPGDGDAILGAAIALGQGSDPTRAIPLFDKLLKAQPGRSDLIYNKALAQKAMGDLAGAEAGYRAVIERAPDLTAAYRNLGNLLLEQGRAMAAAEVYAKGFRRRRARGGNLQDPELRAASAAKLRHDLEQIEYLLEINRLEPEDSALADGYRKVLAEVEAVDPTGRVQLTDAQLGTLGGSYQRILHLDPAEAITGPVLNPALDPAEITRRYFDGSTRMVVVDDLLTVDALTALRRFMNESSIWHKWRFANDNGYVGAMLADGFFNPLLVQLTETLRTWLPEIIGRHRLKQTWAFKHSERIAGVPIHADTAAVNVNLYTTPDDANLDPATGGIVVWDKPAPLDWDFEQINVQEGALERFVEEVGATPTWVAHKQNRIVIFDSDLVHKTDDLHFRPGYLNRRINVTMLYGRRHDHG